MKSLIIFNKPCGVICQFSPHEKHPSLKDYIDAPGFYPAGRLDTDSEGLLLLTNDGQLQARITQPRFKVEKTYWAQLEGMPDTDKLQLLQRPMDLGGCPRKKLADYGRATRPCASEKPCLIFGWKSKSAKAKTAKSAAWLPKPAIPACA